MKATFKVTFLLQKGKLKASGKAPIVTRIIVNGEMVHFSTQQEIEPDRWDAKGNRTLGLRAEERTINRILDEIKASLHRYYYDCQASGESVSALKLKNKLCSTEEKPIKSTMELFDKFITEYAELVKAKGYGKEALLRYKICKNRVQEFLKKEMHADDIPVESINKRLLDKFYLWNRTVYKIGNNTAIHFMHKFSTVYKMALDYGWVSGNPFHMLKLRKDKTERAYLTIDELERLANKEFSSERLERMRDIFLFCCYTGLAYIDVKTLTTENLVQKADGKWWLVTKRTKTEVPVNVPLLEVPMRLIKKYEPLRKGNLVFPVYSNQKSNDYLKEIATLCDIHKDVTFHVARPVLESDNTKVEVKTVVNTVTDTAYIELPVIVEKVATLDTASVLENKYAKSEASVSDGVLHHSLQTKPVREPVKVERVEVVRDSLVYRDRVQTVTVEVEKELTWWQDLKLKVGGMALLAIALLVAYFLITHIINLKFFKL